MQINVDIMFIFNLEKYRKNIYIRLQCMYYVQGCQSIDHEIFVTGLNLYIFYEILRMELKKLIKHLNF
ncbi:MAG: hypothetical protein Kow00117_00610 [Phototrophicales bacterium]